MKIYYIDETKRAHTYTRWDKINLQRCFLRKKKKYNDGAAADLIFFLSEDETEAYRVFTQVMRTFRG